jgi:hypothetical protein
MGDIAAVEHGTYKDELSNVEKTQKGWNEHSLHANVVIVR